MNKNGKTTLKIGIFLSLIVLSSSFYFMFEKDDVGIKFYFDDYGVEYQTLQNGSYENVANQFVRLYNGTTWIKNAESRTHYWLNHSGDYYEAVVDVTYRNNVSYKIISKFNVLSDSVETSPESSKIECYNCEDLRMEVWITGIDYNDETKVIESPFEFNPNMKLEWDDRAYYSKVFNYITVSDKIFIKYRPESNYEVYNVRLFDPPKVKWIYEDVEYKDPKYKTKEICFESEYNDINDTWSEAYCYNETTIDYYETKIKKVKTDKFEYKTKIYNEKHTHYYEDKKEIHEFNVPIGERNWDFHCRQWEEDKGVCEVIKVK